MPSSYRFLFLLLAVINSVCLAQEVIVKHDDPHIRYMGRIGMQTGATEIWWTSTSVKLNFKGTTVKATLKDAQGANYFNVMVDDKLVSVLRADSVKTEYTLASALPYGNHSIELFKRTGWTNGKTLFYQFSLDNGAQLQPQLPVKTRKMEFFGNSITCGVTDEMPANDTVYKVIYDNSYLSYAALTARHFNAEFHNTSLSGIGLMVSWFPLIMPEMYNRHDPFNAKSLWDFNKYTPDVVVINLGQNDSWIVKLPQHAQFKARFGATAPNDRQIVAAYTNFIKTIRGTYPKAQIICVLGSMDATKAGSPWPGYIQQAVNSLGDKKILTHFFPYINNNRHPNVKEHQAMADDLIAFMNKNMVW